MGEFDKSKYDIKYAKENYERINLTVPKGNRQKLKELAKAKNTSVNGLVIESLRNHYYLDIETKR